eukprot:30850-Pelagococcus_subviridis.AAC.14
MFNALTKASTLRRLSSAAAAVASRASAASETPRGLAASASALARERNPNRGAIGRVEANAATRHRAWTASPFLSAQQTRAYGPYHTKYPEAARPPDAWNDPDLRELDADGKEILPRNDYHVLNIPKHGTRNKWRRRREKAAFIQWNATVNRENRTKRNIERQEKRVEKWRTLAANARAYKARVEEEAAAAAAAAEAAEAERREEASEGGGPDEGARAKEGTRRCDRTSRLENKIESKYFKSVELNPVPGETLRGLARVEVLDHLLRGDELHHAAVLPDQRLQNRPHRLERPRRVDRRDLRQPLGVILAKHVQDAKLREVQVRVRAGEALHVPHRVYALAAVRRGLHHLDALLDRSHGVFFRDLQVAVFDDVFRDLDDDARAAFLVQVRVDVRRALLQRRSHVLVRDRAQLFPPSQEVDELRGRRVRVELPVAKEPHHRRLVALRRVRGGERGLHRLDARGDFFRAALHGLHPRPDLLFRGDDHARASPRRAIRSPSSNRAPIDLLRLFYRTPRRIAPARRGRAVASDPPRARRGRAHRAGHRARVCTGVRRAPCVEDMTPRFGDDLTLRWPKKYLSARSILASQSTHAEHDPVCVFSLMKRIVLHHTAPTRRNRLKFRERGVSPLSLIVRFASFLRRRRRFDVPRPRDFLAVVEPRRKVILPLHEPSEDVPRSLRAGSPYPLHRVSSQDVYAAEKRPERRIPPVLLKHLRVQLKRRLALAHDVRRPRLRQPRPRVVQSFVHGLHVLGPPRRDDRLVVLVERGDATQSQRALRRPPEHAPAEEVREVPAVEVREQQRRAALGGAALRLRGFRDSIRVRRRRARRRVRVRGGVKQRPEVVLERFRATKFRGELSPDPPARRGAARARLARGGVESTLERVVEVVVRGGELRVRGSGRQRRERARAEDLMMRWRERGAGGGGPGG